MATKNAFEMERLNKIAEHRSGVVDTYKGETRDWFDVINDDDVYAAIGDPDFQAFVRLVEAVSTVEDSPCAA